MGCLSLPAKTNQLESGSMVIFSAPSGAGKTTIVRHLMSKEEFRFELSVSACTRKAREGEVNGKDYYFLSPEEFKEKIANGEFMEWEEVYEGRYYGTLKSEVDRIWAKGNNVIFDVDVLGGINIKKQYKDKALSVFVMPPTLEALEKRLRDRATDSLEDIAKRLEKAQFELSYSSQFDIILNNDRLEDTFREIEHIVSEFLVINP